MWKAHSKGLVIGAGGETSVAAKIVRFPLVEISTIKNLGTMLMIGQMVNVLAISPAIVPAVLPCPCRQLREPTFLKKLPLL